MYVDIAILVIVALFALIGLWKGFFKTIISFFGWLVSFLIAFFLTRIVASALLDITQISSLVVGESGSLYSVIFSRLPPDIESTGGFLKIILTPIITLLNKAGVPTGNEEIALLLANGAYSIIVCVALFIVIRILMCILTKVAKTLCANKTIGALNRVFGFVVGAFKGFGLVCIAFILLSFFINSSFMTPVRNQIQDSMVAEPIYINVNKLANKVLGANDNLLKKLLELAGFGDKEPEEKVPAAQIELKDKIAAMTALKDGTFADAYTIKSADYNAYTTQLKEYLDKASSSLAVVLATPITDEDLAAYSKLCSDGGALYTNVNLYLTKIAAIKAEEAKAPAGDTTSLYAEAETARVAILATINDAANAKFKAQFGELKFVKPVPAQQKALQEKFLAMIAVSSGAFDENYKIKSEEYNGYTLQLKTYIANAAGLMAVAHEPAIAADDLTAFNTLCSNGEGGALYANVSLYLAKIATIKAEEAKTPAVDTSAILAAAETARVAILATINDTANAKFKTLFGELTFTKAPVVPPVESVKTFASFRALTPSFCY